MLKALMKSHMQWKIYFSFFLLGLIMAFAQAPFNFSFIYFFTIPIIGLYLRNLREKKISFKIGWWTAFGYFGFTMIWIVEPFLIEPAITGWLAPFALVLMAGGLAVFWALAFYVAVWFTSEGKFRVIFLALSWTFFEYLRSFFFTGFPWGHLSYGLLGLPIIQAVAWFGIHGLGLVLIIICFMPAICSPRIKTGLVLMLSFLLVFTVIGLWRSNGEILSNSRNIIVRVIQPNATQILKWRKDMLKVFYTKQLAYTGIKNTKSPNVVIWPETAISRLLKDSGEIIKEISNTAGPNTSLITGIVRRENNKSRNSLILVNERGDLGAIFDKQHLVPFGEYMPMAYLLRNIGLSSLIGFVGNFESGNGPRIIQSENLPNFLALICYESIFPNYSNNIESRADWIVHITNDAWFGNFSGPYQHLSQARVRAIEQGLPLVRSANTGISAIIDPYGNIISSIELNTAGYFDAVLPDKIPPTLYARFGDLIWKIFFALLLLACFKNIYTKHYRSYFK